MYTINVAAKLGRCAQGAFRRGGTKPTRRIGVTIIVAHVLKTGSCFRLQFDNYS